MRAPAWSSPSTSGTWSRRTRTFDEYADRIRRGVPFVDFAPIVSISAKTGQRVERVLEAALEIAAERRRRVPTAALNALLREAAFRQPPPAAGNKRPRLYYVTQVAIEPPTFVFFASDAASVHFSYRRYLENRIRDAFGFAGTPIRLVFRERERDEIERQRRPFKRPSKRAQRSRPRQAAVAKKATRAVVGAGAWGTTLAVHLARRGPVMLLARNEDHAAELGETRENKRHLAGVRCRPRSR